MADLTVSRSEATQTFEKQGPPAGGGPQAFVPIQTAESVAWSGPFFPVSIAESSVTSEVIGRFLTLAVSVADATSISEFAKAPFPAPISVAEAASLTDSQQPIIADSIVTITETVATSEVVQAPFPSPILALDATSLAETAQATVSFLSVSTVDATSLGDGAQAPFPSPVSASDSTASAETVGAFRVSQTDLTLAVAETLNAADSEISSDTLFIRAQDFAPLGPITNISVAEKATTAEALTVVNFGNVTGAETTLTTEAFVAQWPNPIVVVDATVVSELASAVPLGGNSIFIQESARTSDAATVAIAARTISVADVTITSEFKNEVVVGQFSVFAQDPAVTSESFVVGLPPIITSTLETSVSEVVATADIKSVLRVPATSLTVAESEVTATSEQLLVARANVIVRETPILSDSVAITFQGGATATDRSSAGDQAHLDIPVIVDIVEGNPGLLPGSLLPSGSLDPLGPISVTLSEGPNVAIGYTVATTDAISTAEVVGPRLDSNVTVVETTRVADVAAEFQGAAVSIADATVTSESFGATLEKNVAALDTVHASESAVAQPEVLIVAGEAAVTAEFEAEFVLSPGDVGALDITGTSESIVLVVSDPTVSVGEATSTSEQPQAILADLVAVTDVTRTTETFAASLELDPSALEVLSASELFGVQSLLFAVSVADATSTAESLFVAEQLIAREATTTSETVTLTFGGTANVADVAIVADSVTLAAILQAVVAVDVVRSSESVLALPTIKIASAEVVVTSEFAFPEADALIVTNESAHVSETTSELLPTTGSVAPGDLITSADSALLTLVVFTVRSDATVTTESARPNIVITTSTVERAKVTETVGIAMTVSAAALDNATTAEVVRFSTTFQPSVIDHVGTFESVAGALSDGWSAQATDHVGVHERTRVRLVRRWHHREADVTVFQRSGVAVPDPDGVT